MTRREMWVGAFATAFGIALKVKPLSPIDALLFKLNANVVRFAGQQHGKSYCFCHVISDSEWDLLWDHVAGVGCSEGDGFKAMTYKGYYVFKSSVWDRLPKA